MTTPGATSHPPRIAIVGGGLAGLAAAVALSGRGLALSLFEARSYLGGRATSYRESRSDTLVDHCQHVSLGCCTNLADFCRRTGIEHLFRRDRVLHFFGPDGRRFDLAGRRWLPAPLHLAPALWGLGYLSVAERWRIGPALLRLARLRSDDPAVDEPIGPWLTRHGQSPAAVARFWSPVLVSSLGESVERASVLHARKVFVDAFLAHRAAYEVLVPRVPLGELYGRRLVAWLAANGVELQLAQPIVRVEGQQHVEAIVSRSGQRYACDGAVVAVPWHRMGGLLDERMQFPVSQCGARAERIESAPITGVHLWFDRPLTPLPHAVFVDRLTQWVFNRGPSCADAEPGEPEVRDSAYRAHDAAATATATAAATQAATATQAGAAAGAAATGRDDPRDPPENVHRVDRPLLAGTHYYQVVISASHALAGQPREMVVGRIVDELSAVWPAARSATLVHWRVVTESDAVFSVTGGIERLRPGQATDVGNLALAGDWTDTGWPATMEGAVRSGYLAAEHLLDRLGQPARCLVDDLPRGPLARLLLWGR